MQDTVKIDKRQMLARHILFRQLLPTEIDAILALMVERRYKDSQIIFTTGDEGSSMMIVLTGRVLISALSDEGKEITLNYIEPGGILGEIALLDGKQRSANATAVGACSVLSIQRADFIPFLRTSPDVAIQLLMVFCDKLRKTSCLVESLGLLPVAARLAQFILKQASAEPLSVAPDSVIRLNLSQQKIANLIGASRETVNRTLSQWQEHGWISLQRQKLTIHKPKALSAVAESSL